MERLEARDGEGSPSGTNRLAAEGTSGEELSAMVVRSFVLSRVDTSVRMDYTEMSVTFKSLRDKMLCLEEQISVQMTYDGQKVSSPHLPAPRSGSGTQRSIRAEGQTEIVVRVSYAYLASKPFDSAFLLYSLHRSPNTVSLIRDICIITDG